MREFWSFYRWGLNMKSHMAIYTVALIFFKSIVNLTQGSDAVSIWTMLQMLLISMAFATCEVYLFPEDKELSVSAVKRRTICWAVLGNVLIVGGAMIFKWFEGVPAWASGVLALLLESSLLAMWLGIHVARRKDTEHLNKNLRSYQQEH